uniref:Left end of bacteriophage phi-29 coding for 15 potential proteins Among these are the terminal protein and the proteins encoded by the genes 1, 2 (sus), 3, and (probably) 4 n=1 Tax=Salasvirus phi29 TaxID=10756 RepID=Q38507_9CAUD|nr:unnamed protein product [Bacillus phage phi29]
MAFTMSYDSVIPRDVFTSLNVIRMNVVPLFFYYNYFASKSSIVIVSLISAFL